MLSDKCLLFSEWMLSSHQSDNAHIYNSKKSPRRYTNLAWPFNTKAVPSRHKPCMDLLGRKGTCQACSVLQYSECEPATAARMQSLCHLGWRSLLKISLGDTPNNSYFLGSLHNCAPPFKPNQFNGLRANGSLPSTSKWLLCTCGAGGP
jgi:hypothetical protein